MNRKLKITLAGGAALLALPLMLFSANNFVFAADHLDPPMRTNPAVDTTPDTPADIADVYAWHTADSVIIAMTFAGPQPTTRAAFYDRDVNYRINISNAAPASSAEFPINVRFGRSADGQFGVRFSGLPGVTGDIEGPVETNLVKDGVTVRAGLFDDPFFFDLQGFNDTLRTGTLSFSNTRNFFAGQNLTAVVVEIPRARLANGTNELSISGATSRFGGQL